MSAQRATTYLVVALVAFLIGGLVASQPGVRRAVERSGLSRALSLGVGEELPDLLVTSLPAPPSAKAGSVIAVSYTVTNRGKADVSHEYSDCVFLTAGSGGLNYLGSYNQTESVRAGESYSQTLMETLPAVPPGSYSIVLRTDCFGQIEQESGSNEATVPITIN